ncbi:hypothetical protein RSOL_280610, partial [Rhizoctonia solani AG-3 Rhs1AP]
MSSAKPSFLKPISVGSEDVLNKDSGKHPEQIGCLIAKLQGINLDGKGHYCENSNNSDDDMADVESNSSDEETIVYPKKQGKY